MIYWNFANLFRLICLYTPFITNFKFIRKNYEISLKVDAANHMTTLLDTALDSSPEHLDLHQHLLARVNVIFCGLPDPLP